MPQAQDWFERNAPKPPTTPPPAQAPPPIAGRGTGGIDHKTPISDFIGGIANMVLPSKTLGDYLEPARIVSSLAGAPPDLMGESYVAEHPLDSLKLVFDAIVGAHKDQASKTADAAHRMSEAQGPLGKAAAGSEMVGHALATAVPLIGPAAANAGETIQRGDIATGFGEATGLLAPGFLKPVGSAMSSAAEKVAAAADRVGTQKISEVMSPKTGQNKAQFGAMSDRVAGQIAREPGLAAASRSSLLEKIEGKLSDATTALDDAISKIPRTRMYGTRQIVAALERTRADLTVRGIKGKDIVPEPNQAAYNILTTSIDEVKGLGNLANFDNLRALRQAWDSEAARAKAYAKTTQDMSASKTGAAYADSATALREYLASREPAIARQNKDYALFKTAADVLRAAETAERVRPKRGVKLAASMVGAAGGSAMGWEGAAVGVMLGPILDHALTAGTTTKIMTGRLLVNLADALQNNRSASAQRFLKDLATISGQTGRLDALIKAGKDEK